MIEKTFPSPLDEVALVAGDDAAQAMLDQFGGTRISIPAEARHDHWLTVLVGWAAAQKICAHFRTLSADNDRPRGARHIVIPKGNSSLLKKAKARYYLAREQGMSVREAARFADVHEVTAFRYERALKSDNDRLQLSLFDRDKSPGAKNQ